MLVITKGFIGSGINGISELVIESSDFSKESWELALQENLLISFTGKVRVPVVSCSQEHILAQQKSFAMPAANIIMVCEK